MLQFAIAIANDPFASTINEIPRGLYYIVSIQKW